MIFFALNKAYVMNLLNFVEQYLMKPAGKPNGKLSVTKQAWYVLIVEARNITEKKIRKTMSVKFVDIVKV